MQFHHDLDPTDLPLSFCARSSCQRFTAHYSTLAISLQAALCRALFISVGFHFNRIHARLFALAATLQLGPNQTWSFGLVLSKQFGIY